MALPPPGDPQRPLHLAVRLARVLGVAFLALGLLVTLPRLVRARGGGWWLGIELLLSEGMVLFALPGAAYVIFSIFLARRRRWAAVAALVLALLHFALALFALVRTLVYAPWIREPLMLIPLGIVTIFALAPAALGYYLIKSFPAIRERPPEVERGFDPLPAAVIVQPVAVPGDVDVRSVER